MNNKDIGIASRSTGHVEEMDVVLGKRHDRLVAGGVRCLFDIHPRDGAGVGGGHFGHVKEKQLSTGERIKHVGVVVEDGIEVRRVELARGDRLSAPGLRGCVENVHR